MSSIEKISIEPVEFTLFEFRVDTSSAPIAKGVQKSIEESTNHLRQAEQDKNNTYVYTYFDNSKIRDPLHAFSKSEIKLLQQNNEILITSDLTGFKRYQNVSSNDDIIIDIMQLFMGGYNNVSTLTSKVSFMTPDSSKTVLQKINDLITRWNADENNYTEDLNNSVIVENTFEIAIDLARILDMPLSKTEPCIKYIDILEINSSDLHRYIIYKSQVENKWYLLKSFNKQINSTQHYQKKFSQ